MDARSAEAEARGDRIFLASISWANELAWKTNAKPCVLHSYAERTGGTPTGGSVDEAEVSREDTV